MKNSSAPWKLLKKSWPLLFWLGPVLVIMGLSAGIIAGWGLVPQGLMIAGGVVLIAWMIFQTRSVSGFWVRRSTQASANALLATIAVFVILGLINFLGVRYAQKVDLTENQLYTLAPQSQAIVRELEQPVKVWVFMDPGDPRAGTIRTLLEQYRDRGSKFSFEFVDPQARPGLAQSFGVQESGDIFLESGSRQQFLISAKTEPLTETRLTNGLEQISSDRQAKVYFLQGHGEPPLTQGSASFSQAVTLLKDKNFTSEPLNLSERGSVPTDASVVVVAGPRQALLEPEVAALQSYLQAGGSVLLMIDPETNPQLDPLLKKWGVTLENRLAINASQQQTLEFRQAAPVVSQYGDHPITQDFGNRFSVYPIARPIDIQQVPGVTSTPLLITSEQTWAESDPKNPQLEFNPDRDRPGPLLLGAALSQPVSAAEPAKPSPEASPSPSPSESPSASPSPSPTDTASPSASPSPSPSPSPTNSPTAEKTEAKEARLVVLGNSRFATDGLFTQQLNSDVFLNSVSWLSKRDDQVLSIRPKEARNRRITMTNQQANIVGWLAVLLLPLLGFGAAGTVWWRRR